MATPIPKTICGIETQKSSIDQRREIVKKEYQKLLERLKNTTGKKVIHNDFLDVDVHLIMGEGGKEVGNRGAFNWQSTYAIIKLEEDIFITVLIK